MGGESRSREEHSYSSRFKNNCFAVMRSSSEEGSYLGLVDFVSLISRPRVIKKKKKNTACSAVHNTTRYVPPATRREIFTPFQPSIDFRLQYSREIDLLESLDIVHITLLVVGYPSSGDGVKSDRHEVVGRF